MLSSVLCVMLSIVVGAIGSPSLQLGKYCAFPVKERDYATCMFFDYDSPSSAYLVYNYFDRHFFAMGYDNVTLEDDKIIMTRYGHTEGPQLIPYYDVRFDLKVSSDKPDVVRVVAKNEKYTYTLTKGCKLPPGVKAASFSNPIHREQRQRRLSSLEERQPDGTYQAVPGPSNHAFILGANSTTQYGYTSHFDSKRNTFWYYSYDSKYTLKKGSFGQIFKFDNPYVKISSALVKIPAEYMYDPKSNLVYFIPNNKSLPDIKASTY